MLRVLGSAKKLCDGLTRRDLLRLGTLGFLGLGDWLRLREVQAAPGANNFGKAKHCILLFLFGSPSQHDTFDPKPNAPEGVRGELRPISTNVPGTQICELLPRIARVCDKATIVRSLTHAYPIHGVAYAITSTPTIDIPMQLNRRDPRHWPFIGSAVDYLDERGGSRGQAPVPGNICLPWVLSSRNGHSTPDAGPYGHSLGSAYDPLWVEFEGQGTDVPYYYNLNRPNPRNPFAGVHPDCRFPLAGSGTRPADISLGRIEERHGLLGRLEAAHLAVEETAATHAFDRHQRSAFSLVTTARTSDALDISREPMVMRERYGMHLFGQATLAARRLVEAGCRFTTVFWDDYHEAANAWDTHYAHYPNMRNVLCPGLDQTLSALLEDLDQRGLLDETLVAVLSEHGRTPRLTMTPQSRGGGRGHWSRAYSALLAGGGIARGRVVGRTDGIGGEVSETPISPKDILATMYHLLGIDPETPILDRQGRPYPVAGEGRVRLELLG